MGHSYASIRLHIVFSTFERRKTITPATQSRLWAYIAGVARKLDAQVFEVGGVADHVHVFATLPATLTAAQLVQKLKANSSRWMRQNGASRFEWQRGYGAFSVSASATEEVRAYIHGQEEHHRKHTFEEEFLSLLKRYGLEYDPKYVLG